MAETTDRHDDLCGNRARFLAGLADEKGAVGGHAASSCEFEGLADGEVREVLVDLFDEVLVGA